MHLVAIARAAGITLTWDDLSDLSAVVPLLSRIYPNGAADVNHFHAAGGIAFLVHTLLRRRACCTTTCRRSSGHGLSALHAGAGAARRRRSPGRRARRQSLDLDGAAPGRRDPFSPDGGLRMLDRPARPRGHQDLGGQAGAPGGDRAGAWSSTTRHDFLDGVRPTASSTAATSSR